MREGGSPGMPATAAAMGQSYRAAAGIASAGSNGDALPSPFSSRPQWVQVPGRNWAMPCAPAGETAAGLKPDSCCSWAASRLSVSWEQPADVTADASSGRYCAGIGPPGRSCPPLTPPEGISAELTLLVAAIVTANAASSTNVTGSTTGTLIAARTVRVRMSPAQVLASRRDTSQRPSGCRLTTSDATPSTEAGAAPATCAVTFSLHWTRTSAVDAVGTGAPSGTATRRTRTLTTARCATH